MRCSNNGTCIDKKDTTAAYCKCDGTGYEGPFCENDINECLTNNGGCHATLGICTNTVGSFTCACISGYHGNGITCTGNNYFFQKYRIESK